MSATSRSLFWSAAPLGITLAAGLAVGPALAITSALGRNIPTVDAGTDYAGGFLWAALLGATILLWPVAWRERLAVFGVWGIKCLVTLGFMLLYEANYAALDAYEYFLSGPGTEWSWNIFYSGGGTQLMHMIAGFHLDWMIPSSYHALKVTFSFVGLLAIYVYYRAACRFLGERRINILYAVALVPSILFWSSILGKDPFVMLGIALFSYGVVGWLSGYHAKTLGWALLGLVLASVIRLWLAPILAGSVFLVALGKVPGTGRRILVATAGALVIVPLLYLLRGYFALETIADLTAASGTLSQAWAEGGSAQKLAADLSDPVQLVKFLPLGIVTALLRPLPGEVNNAFGLLAGLENFVLLTLLGLSVARTRAAEMRSAVLWWAIVFVLFWATIYGPISYQNLGSGVRFRLQVLPVFVLVLLHLSRRRVHTGAATPSRA